MVALANLTPQAPDRIEVQGETSSGDVWRAVWMGGDLWLDHAAIMSPPAWIQMVGLVPMKAQVTQMMVDPSGVCFFAAADVCQSEADLEALKELFVLLVAAAGGV